MRIWTSANEAIDVCAACEPTEAHAFNRWGNVGDGPDGRGNCFSYDSEHPDYDQGDYRCPFCSVQLVEAIDA